MNPFVFKFDQKILGFPMQGLLETLSIGFFVIV